jgi:hypothetical protein
MNDRWVGRLLAIGWAALAAVPLTSAMSAVLDGWLPVGDTALIAARTVDSISLDPPLVGAPTTLGAGGPSLHHPGPLGFWLLSIPTRLLGEPGHGLVLGSAAVSILSIVGIAVLMRRRRDPLLESIVLVLVAAMVWSIGGAQLCDPFNPYLGILPLLLFMFSVWGVMSGHHLQLLPAIAAGSLTAQLHLSYVPLVASLVGVASVSLALDLWRGSVEDRRRLTRRIIPAGMLLGLAAWAGPVADQIAGRHNLSRLVSAQRTSSTRTVGLESGFNLLVDMTSLPPRWMMERASSGVIGDPGVARTVLAAASIGLATAIGVWALRRRDRTLASLCAVGLVGIGVSTVSSGGITRTLLAEQVLFYRLFWWPVGVMFTMSIVWGLVRVASTIRVDQARNLRAWHRRRWVVAVLCAAVVIIAPFGYQSTNPALAEAFDPYVDHSQAIAALPGHPETVVLSLRAPGTAESPESTVAHFFAQPLLAQLRLRGISVRLLADEGDAGALLNDYRSDHPAAGNEDADVLLLVGDGVEQEDPEGFRLISADVPPSWPDGGGFEMPSAIFVQVAG